MNGSVKEGDIGTSWLTGGVPPQRLQLVVSGKSKEESGRDCQESSLGEEKGSACEDLVRQKLHWRKEDMKS